MSKKNVQTCFLCDSKSPNSYHRFPKELSLRSQWMKICHLQAGEDVDKLRICGNHFSKKDMYTTHSGRILLKAKALPSLNVVSSFLLPRYDPLQGSQSVAVVSKELSNQVQQRSCSSGEIHNDDLNANKERPKEDNQNLTREQSDGSILKGKETKKNENICLQDGPPPVKKTKYLILVPNFINKIHEKTLSPRNLKPKMKGRFTNSNPTFEEVLKKLKKDNLISNQSLELVELSLSQISKPKRNQIFINPHLKEKYFKEIQNFAVLLHFFSPESYEILLERFTEVLPPVSTIRNLTSKTDYSPGYSQQAMNTLKMKSEEYRKRDKQLICSLILDEVQVIKDCDNSFGYVNVGVNLEDDSNDPTKEVLVVLVTCLTAPWKIPIGYFCVNHLSKREKANIIKESIIRLSKVGVTVATVTVGDLFDCFKIAEELGCDIKCKNYQTWFRHPCENRKVYFFIDTREIMRAIKMYLESQNVILDPVGNEIKWEYIEDLILLRKEPDLLLEQKIGKSNIFWQKRKVALNLFTHDFLSYNVADILEFFKKDLGIKKFADADPTIAFIRRINNLYNIFNSRNSRSKNFNSPLKPSNIFIMNTYLRESIEYLSNCKDIDGQYICKRYRSMAYLSFTSFIINAYSAMGIFDDYIRGPTRKLEYFLTNKTSQDHLSTLFFDISNVLNIWDFPRAFKFAEGYKKILKSADHNGVLEEKTLIQVDNKLFDMSLYRKYNKNNKMFKSDYTFSNFSVIMLSEHRRDVVAYIGKFVIKMALKQLLCESCINALISKVIADEDEDFLVPSQSVIDICYETEMQIKRALIFLNNRLSINKNFLPLFINSVAQKIYQKNFFEEQQEHFLDTNYEHLFMLVKNLIYCYYKIRHFYTTNNWTEEYLETKIREGCKLLFYSQ